LTAELYITVDGLDPNTIPLYLPPPNTQNPKHLKITAVQQKKIKAKRERKDEGKLTISRFFR
jgi:hypothetical protein